MIPKLANLLTPRRRSVKTKADIHHLPYPIFVGECINCGACIKVCPGNAIKKGKDKVIFDYDLCWGCDACVEVCPQKALKPEISNFDQLLAEGAYAAVKKVKKAYYINVMSKITKLCDCAADNGPILSPDLGYLASEDIVAIDRSSLDIINKKAGKNLFLEVNHKDPYKQVNEIESLLK